MTMSKWQRIEATIRGEAVDRTPLSMWVHYHLQDRGPQRLAESTYRLYREFDLDLLKQGAVEQHADRAAGQVGSGQQALHRSRPIGLTVTALLLKQRGRLAANQQDTILAHAKRDAGLAPLTMKPVAD